MSRHFMLSQTSLAVVLALTAGAVQAAEEETVVVVGQQEDSSVGPDFSYLGISSRTATKTDLPISETPRAVSVVTREQMDDRASVSISDALQYTPSIQTNYYGEDNKQDWFVIRGFQQAGAGLYQDGTRLYSAGFYSWQIDPFGLERVEILRGPASVLYGQNPPGGVINVVSKRPQFDGGSGQVAVEYGSFDRKQISLDVNSEINDELALKGNGGGVLVNSTIEEADSRQNRASPAVTASVEVAGFRAQINKLRADQASFLDEAETRAVEDADRYKGVLRLTGVGVGRVVEQADTQVGGPLVEITPASDISDPALTADEIEFKNRVREVKARLDEAEMLEDLVHAMPLGVPVGSDFRFTSGFGKRVDPVRGGLALHLGLDMAAFRNAPITAPAPGTVVFSGRNGAYGLCVEIDHGYGFRTRYGHLAKLSVKKGDVVTLGQKLGGMGTTGRSTGVHLHYEVYFRGKTYDPRKFLRAGKHVYEG